MHVFRSAARLRGVAAIVGAVLMFACAVAQPASAQKMPGKVFSTTSDYIWHFYPLWFTYNQSKFATHNHLVGPDRISPIYQVVVAINDDTLYASTFLDLAAQPVVLTVPGTKTHYSILTLDPYGDIFNPGIAANTPGTYVLTGPGYTGTLPKNVTHISMPLDHSVIIFRADKYVGAQNMTADAELFRTSLLMQTLSAWQSNPKAGGTLILPETAFAQPYKVTADTLVQKQPLDFLRQLQTAVASSDTPPLSAGDKALSDEFNQLFAANPNDPAFPAAVQDAHHMILQSYLGHTDQNKWIDFLNIGQWTPQEAILRSAITEYIQYGNNHAAAAYYHTFKDKTGLALDGSVATKGYVLVIPKDKLPQASRFWSFTAYTPESIELVANSANKYEIASYTPGLQYNGDGSLTLYMATALPAGVPSANWLPVPNGRFNIMLRVYGPEGEVAAGTYLPPGIVKR